MSGSLTSLSLSLGHTPALDDVDVSSCRKWRFGQARSRVESEDHLHRRQRVGLPRGASVWAAGMERALGSCLSLVSIEHGVGMKADEHGARSGGAEGDEHETGSERGGLRARHGS